MQFTFCFWIYFIEIQEAIQSKDLEKLDRIMNEAGQRGDFSLKKDLGVVLDHAEELRSRLRRIKRLQHAVLEMDQKTISELRSYSKPPPAVHAVMATTFLLLGNKEADLKVTADNLPVSTICLSVIL